MCMCVCLCICSCIGLCCMYAYMYINCMYIIMCGGVCMHACIVNGCMCALTKTSARMVSHVRKCSIRLRNFACCLLHTYMLAHIHTYMHIHSFILILAISIAPLQVLYYSEALPTTARTLYQSFTPKRTSKCR